MKTQTQDNAIISWSIQELLTAIVGLVAIYSQGLCDHHCPQALSSAIEDFSTEEHRIVTLQERIAAQRR